MNSIKTIPKFEKNVHYIEQHPSVSKNKYRFKLLKDISIIFKQPLVKKHKILKFYHNDVVWAIMSHNRLIIIKDYAWDGCTPKRWIGFWAGSPDFEETIIASLVHDVLLQFRETENFPFDRYQIDNIFKDILNIQNFKFKGIYYTGVRLGSMVSNKKHDTYSKLTSISID